MHIQNKYIKNKYKKNKYKIIFSLIITIDLLFISIFIYISLYIERGRERYIYLYVFVQRYMDIWISEHIYIYMHIWISGYLRSHFGSSHFGSILASELGPLVITVGIQSSQAHLVPCPRRCSVACFLAAAVHTAAALQRYRYQGF